MLKSCGSASGWTRRAYLPERSIEVWEATNRRHFAVQGVEPLTWEIVPPHRELARHSLLLLMPALYDAVGNPLRRLGDHDIRRLDLYEWLLVEFVRREVVKHQGLLAPSAEAEAVDKELGRLGVIAMGMFNRRSQNLTADQADSDIDGLLGEGGSTRLFGRFFFVHPAQAVVAEERLRSYEFLHATFGEYLVARLLCDEVRRVLAEWERTGATRGDGDMSYPLLSFVPLSDRAEVRDNIRELFRPGGSRWHGSLPGLLRTQFQRGGDQVKATKTCPGEAVQECGEQRAVRPGELWLVGLSLQHGQLVAQRQDLGVLVAIAHRQELVGGVVVAGTGPGCPHYC
ncbi:hypothetical protein GCM10020367_58990 [Streptomyces sannanensis]|uniref:Uncharacterized protein n=1 Tax=Streptomyces sannanensis TaxID=285536 RepID=A0ABP6SKW3_9ACTN